MAEPRQAANIHRAGTKDRVSSFILSSLNPTLVIGPPRWPYGAIRPSFAAENTLWYSPSEVKSDSGELFPRARVAIHDAARRCSGARVRRQYGR